MNRFIKDKLRLTKLSLIVLIIISIALSLVAVLQCAFYSVLDDEITYTFSVNNKKNPEALGAEVRITDIRISDRKYDLTLLENYGIYADDMLTITPYEKNISFDLNAHINDVIKVACISHPWSGILNICTPYFNEDIDLYSQGGTKEIILNSDFKALFSAACNKIYQRLFLFLLLELAFFAVFFSGLIFVYLFIKDREFVRKLFSTPSSFVIAVTISLALSLTATVQCICYNISDNEIVYTFSINNKRNPLAQGAEARISEISISGQQYDLTRLSNYGIYDNNMLTIMPYERDVSFELVTQIDDVVEVTCITHPWSGIMNISNPYFEKSMDLYSEGGLKTERLSLGPNEIIRIMQDEIINNFWFYLTISIFFLSASFISVSLICMIFRHFKLKDKLMISNHAIAILTFLAVILACFSVLQYAYGNISDKKVTYTFSVDNKKNPESKGAEIRIIELSVSNAPYDLSLFSEYGTYEDGILTLIPYDNPVSFDLTVSYDDIVSIMCITHPWSGILNVSTPYFSENIDCYAESGNRAESFYLDTITRISFAKDEIICNISLYLPFGMIVFILDLLFMAIINFLIELIKRNKFRPRHIALMCVSWFMILFFSIYGIISISPIIAVAFIGAALTISVYRVRNIFKTHLENVYALIASLAGIVFALTLPYGHVPDEFAHMGKAYALSEGYAYTTAERYVVDLPDDEREISNFFCYNVMNIGLKYNVSDILKFYKHPVNYLGNRTSVNYSNTLNINEFSYIPTSVVILISHFIPMPALLIMQISRTLNFIIASTAFYLSIKHTPRFKRIFFMVSLFPICIQQTAAINQDWITNAVIFLFASLVFEMAFSENIINITTNNFFELAFLSVCLGFVKMAYFPITLLVLLIPDKRFKNKKYSVIFKLIIITIAFVLCIGQALPTYLGGQPHLQDCHFFTLSEVIRHPIQTIKIFWNTFVERGILDFNDGLLNGFGWSIKWTPGIMRTLVSKLLLLLIFTNREDKFEMTTPNKLIILFSMLGMWGMVYMALLTGYTDLNSSIVCGLQSRYFIPVVLPMYILFTNKTFTNRSPKINRWVCYSSLFALIVGINTMICGYYLI